MKSHHGSLVILPLLSLLASSQAHAWFGQDIVRKGGEIVRTGIDVVAAPVVAPIKVVTQVVSGAPVTADDLLIAAVPPAAQLQAAAQHGVPGAAEAQSVAALPLNLGMAIVALRKDAEHLDSTLSRADATMEDIRTAAQSAKATADAAGALTDTILKSGQRLVVMATEILITMDPTASNAEQLRAHAKELLHIGQSLLAVPPSARPVS